MTVETSTLLSSGSLFDSPHLFLDNILADTEDTVYDRFQLILTDISVNSNDTDIWIRFGTGDTYLPTKKTYQYIANSESFENEGEGNSTASESSNHIALAGNGITQDALTPGHLIIDIFLTASGSPSVSWRGIITGEGSSVRYLLGSGLCSDGNLNSLELLPSTHVANATFNFGYKLYGFSS